MKKLILLFFLIPTLIFSQQCEEWIKQFENPEFDSEKLKSENVISKYLTYDFSELLIPNTEFLGYIGKEYQRIFLEFSSVKKNEIYTKKYTISGFSIVHNNKCDFKGSLVITQIREFEQMHFGVDNEFENTGIQSQGIAYQLQSAFV